MREFSKNERKIIVSSLITGSGLADMLSDDFRLRSKFHITYKTNGTQVFQFSSDVLGKDKAYAELIDLLNLLQYLLDEGLVVAYPIAATVERNFTLQDEGISLGNTDGYIPQKWMPEIEDRYIGEFIKRHENSHFKATEPLISVANHNWQTWDERKHNESISVARIGTWTAIGIALITGVSAGVNTWYQYHKSYDELTGKLHNQGIQLEATKGNVKVIQYSYDVQIQKLNHRVDSLISIIYKIQKETKSNAIKNPN